MSVSFNLDATQLHLLCPFWVHVLRVQKPWVKISKEEQIVGLSVSGGNLGTISTDFWRENEACSMRIVYVDHNNSIYTHTHARRRGARTRSNSTTDLLLYPSQSLLLQSLPLIGRLYLLLRRNLLGLYLCLPARALQIPFRDGRSERGGGGGM